MMIILTYGGDLHALVEVEANQKLGKLGDEGDFVQ